MLLRGVLDHGAQFSNVLLSLADCGVQNTGNAHTQVGSLDLHCSLILVTLVGGSQFMIFKTSITTLTVDLHLTFTYEQYVGVILLFLIDHPSLLYALAPGLPANPRIREAPDLSFAFIEALLLCIKPLHPGFKPVFHLESMSHHYSN